MDLGPSDLSVLLFFLFCSLVISVIVFFATKKNALLTIFTMSTLSNLSVYVLKSTLLFWEYDILWLKSFMLDILPWINLLFLIYLSIIFFMDKIKNND